MLSVGVSAKEARAKSTAWAMTYADLVNVFHYAARYSQ